MTKICVVCKKEPIPGDRTRSFHEFPANNELKQKWMQALQTIGITDKNIKKVSTICSDHFEENSFHQTDGYTITRRLLSIAVPVLNRSNEVLKEIKKNVVISSSVEENCNEICMSHTDACSLNNSFKLSSSTKNTSNLSIIETDTISCIDKSVVSKELETNIVCDSNASSFQEDIKMTTNEKNSMRCKRKRPISGVGNYKPNKKFCFMDGFQPSHISRKDFVSDEAWERFLKLMIYKNNQIAAAKKQSWRRGKQISNFKELTKSLRDKNA